MHPITLYHTTTKLDEVLTEGLKSPHDLGRTCVGIGQAECTEAMLHTISTTTDITMAQAFADDLIFLSRVAKGMITEANFCDYVENHDTEKTSKSPCEIWQSFSTHENDAIRGAKYCYDRNGGRFEMLTDSFPEMHKKWYRQDGYDVHEIPEEVIPLRLFITEAELPQLNAARTERGFSPVTWADLVAKEKGRNICLTKNNTSDKANNFLGLAKTYISERERLGKQHDTYILSQYPDLLHLVESQVGIVEIHAQLPKSLADLQRDWQTIDAMKQGGEYRKADLHHYAACNVDGVCGIYPFYKEVRIPPKYIHHIKKLNYK